MNIIQIITLTLLFLSLGAITYGQDFSEWWQQKKTRIKYLEAQDAALAALRLTIENGYQTEEEGLDSISTIKEEEYQLHQKHFESLLIVNPKIKNSSPLVASLQMENDIVDMVATNLHNYTQTPWLSSNERTIINGMLMGLTTNIHESVKSLRGLVTDNYLQLSDGERTKAIDTAAKEIINLYDYTIASIVNLNQLIETRQETEVEFEKLKNLYP